MHVNTVIRTLLGVMRRASRIGRQASPGLPADESDADHDSFLLCEGDCNDADETIYPGATQQCDRKNDDCSESAWPVTPGVEVDNDGDNLAECEGDCDDLNGDVWATPGEVRALRFASQTMIEWAAPLAPGGAVIVYDTLRSPDPADFIGTASCVEGDDGLDTRATDASAPVPGLVFAYLVRAQNDCPAGQGSLGTSSNGAERPGRACP